MPKCFICGKDRPYRTEDFKMLREYAKTHGQFWYFCSWDCLREFVCATIKTKKEYNKLKKEVKEEARRHIYGKI